LTGFSLTVIAVLTESRDLKAAVTFTHVQGVKDESNDSLTVESLRFPTADLTKVVSLSRPLSLRKKRVI
jgi:hypothetical protein